MIVDTSALIAYFNDTEPAHESVRAAIDSWSDLLVVSPYVVAETDHLVTRQSGVPAELAVLRELAGGAWELPVLTADDIATAAGVIEKYGDQAVGIADASIVVLAERYRIRRVATLDRRHFTVLRPLQGGRFALVP